MESFFETLLSVLNPEIGSAWPWYIGGPLIGLIVPVLLYFEGKHFGVSSSLRHLCRAVLPANLRERVNYFQYDLKSHAWSLFFVAGMLLGGLIANTIWPVPESIPVAENTANALAGFGISGLGGLVPVEVFSVDGLLSVPGLLLMIVGGFLVGFGTRYGDGCTSGHAIMGLSLLSPVSLIATVSFFLGGIFTTYVILPLIF